MRDHLILIGFMGAGKSTIACIMAERLDLPCVDLDQRIETAVGRSVAEIFAVDGEQAFREMETQALADLIEEPRSVVACGGGVVVRPENRELLGQLGTVVYLKVSAGEALARVGDAGTRPLLSGEGAALAATSLLQARESLYATSADLVFDTVDATPEAIVDRVIDALEERGEA